VFAQKVVGEDSRSEANEVSDAKKKPVSSPTAFEKPGVEDQEHRNVENEEAEPI
jgi:hypothetical protein